MVERHGFALGGIALVAAVAFGGAVFIKPRDPDNLIALSEASRGALESIFTGGFTSYLPAYRPFAYVTIWVQYQLQGLDLGAYFLFNILVWTAVAWCIYALVYLPTRSRSAAAVAGLAVLLDRRGVISILWIGERQSTLAALAGLGGVLVTSVAVGARERLRPLIWAAVFLLLLVAALSKEYGLAFAAVVPLVALAARRDQWRAALLVSAGAVLAYGLLRLSLAGGATTSLCEDMGFFRDRRTVCYADLGLGGRLEQHAYNVVATFVGTLFPPLFSSSGVLTTPSVADLVAPAIVVGAAVTGALTRPRAALPLLALLPVNALLSFMLYRDRNQIMGLLGLYIVAGLGLALWIVRGRLGAGRWAGAASLAAAAIAVCWLAWNGVQRGRTIETFKATTASSTPCAALERYPNDVDPELVRALNARYGLPDACAVDSP